MDAKKASFNKVLSQIKSAHMTFSLNEGPASFMAQKSDTHKVNLTFEPSLKDCPDKLMSGDSTPLKQASKGKTGEV